MDNSASQIFFQGVVYDTQDPLLLGRLRVVPLNKDYDAIIKSIENWNEKTDVWTSKDPLIFLPLLPFFLNINPKVGELVNIFYQNKNFPYTNQYYITGPLSSPMLSTYEASESSRKMLGEGIRYKQNLTIKKPDGSYWDENSKGVFPEPEDNGILGRGTADVIIKENEVLIRAGKTNELNVNKYPIANDKRAFLQLSNFTQEKLLEETKTIPKLITPIKVVKKMVVWDILNLENTQDKFTNSVGIYNVIGSQKVNTDNFNYDTIQNLSIGTDYVGPIEEYKFNASSVEEVSNLINNVIDGLVDGYINISGYTTNNQNNLINQFPFIVTPSKMTYDKGFTQKMVQIGTQQDINEVNNYINFHKKIKPANSSKTGFVLVWDNKNGNALIGKQQEIKFENVDVFGTNNIDITYGIMGAQKLYLLSHDSDGPKGKIDLSKTIYGIEQSRFVGGYKGQGVENGIYSKTYPTVRGDKLMELLSKIFDFITGHVHPIATLPPVPISAGNGQTTEEIYSILANAQNSILNQNIRIN